MKKKNLIKKNQRQKRKIKKIWGNVSYQKNYGEMSHMKKFTLKSPGAWGMILKSLLKSLTAKSPTATVSWQKLRQ